MKEHMATFFCTDGDITVQGLRNGFAGRLSFEHVRSGIVLAVCCEVTTAGYAMVLRQCYDGGPSHAYGAAAFDVTYA
jgi:hypothetical protein